jgi:hypothetical protein
MRDEDERPVRLFILALFLLACLAVQLLFWFFWRPGGSVPALFFASCPLWFSFVFVEHVP